MTDPDYFAFAVLSVKLHDGQKKWLENSVKQQNVLVTGNRWGKSFVCAVKIIHHALFRPRPLKFDKSGRYRIVTASITQDQAGIIFNEVTRLIRQSGLLEDLMKSLTRTPFPRIEFGNGAVIEARSTQNRGEYLLGNDYDLFIFDEVAFESAPEYVVENVVQMRLADREGKLDLVSTPNGKNWLYQRVKEIKANVIDGYYQTGDSRENSFISQDFIADRLKFFSEQRACQNIMGQFTDTGGEILKGAFIDNALERGSQEREEFGEDTEFLSGWDLARKKTATVGVTIAIKGEVATVIALERFKRFDWEVVVEKIKSRQRKYPGRLMIDATGLGDVVVEQLREYRPEAVIFSAKSKAEMLANVELFHAKDNISYSRWPLPDGVGKVWSFEDEMRSARWDDNNECDALMALALALWPLRRQYEVLPEPRVAGI